MTNINKEGWEIKTIKEVSSFVGDGDWIESKDQSEDGIRLIQTGNVGNGIFKDKGDKAKFISDETFDALGCTEIFAGDCLISRLPDPIGRACLLPNLDQKCITAVDCTILRFTEQIVPKYFVYYSQSTLYASRIISFSTGSTRKRISRKNLERIQIPLPPLPIQQRIVEELDEINAIISAKKQQLQKLDELAQSIFYNMFGEIKDLVALSEYIESFSTGKSLAGEEENANKVLKSGAVTYDYFDKTAVKNLPLDYEPLEANKVKKGDLLVSRMNTPELVGACGYVWEDVANLYLPDRIWRAELRSNANPIFLWKSIISKEAKEQIRRSSSGTSGSMKNISKPNMLRIKIKAVPLPLQEAFAARVSAIEEQKSSIAASIEKMQTLLDARMQEYFG